MSELSAQVSAFTRIAVSKFRLNGGIKRNEQ
jgi:hypothetical protein